MMDNLNSLYAVRELGRPRAHPWVVHIVGGELAELTYPVHGIPASVEAVSAAEHAGVVAVLGFTRVGDALVNRIVG